MNFPNISIENAKLMRSLFYFRLININCICVENNEK